MNDIPKKGGSLLAIAGTVDHLHFICSNPFFNRHTGEISVVAVNISSIREGKPYDKTCVLSEGDHPFIRHDSFVYYKGAVIFRVEKLRFSIQAGEISVLDDVSETVLQKVLQGFKLSPFTPKKILKALELAEVDEASLEKL